MSCKSAQLSLFGEPAPTLRDVADAVREAGIEGLPEAVRRADAAAYQEVHARSALTATKGMPFNWALNPYRGCTHACEYCYARKYQRHLELGAGDDFSRVILVKRNLPGVLAREVNRPGWAHELVAVGTATDPYQPIEGHYRITRQCLEVLTASQTPFSIVTKGTMIVRDRDVLATASGQAGCQVYVSLPSVLDSAWQQLEPGTPSPAGRLRAARVLRDAGIDVAILMMPLVPGISTTRESLSVTLEAIEEAGLRFGGACVARLDPGVREHFFAFLERSHPDLAGRYARLYTRTNARRSYTDAVTARVAGIRRALASGRRADRRTRRPA